MKVADDERTVKNNKKSKKNTCNKSFGIGRSVSERLVIPVKKYDSEVFRMLVQFIHCGSVNITEDTVTGECFYIVYIPLFSVSQNFKKYLLFVYY